MRQLQEKVGEGWSVQIYGSDRRLLCSLYPSHGWALLLGVCLGVIPILIGLQIGSTAVSAPQVTTPTEPPLTVD
ncbi:MAG TPA: hypothetical protein V6D07_14010 [Trichocoleus sp.]